MHIVYISSPVNRRSSTTKTCTAVVAAFAALGCAGNGPSAPTPSPSGAAKWTQVWSEDFDGAAGGRIDESHWSYETGDGCSSSNCGWGNNEKEYYTDSPNNIALNGEGQLMITARVAPAGLACYYGPCKYTSAKITTRGKMSAEPGRVEARIKLSAGQGLWPAFWMLGTSFPTVGWPASGELDIMENKGSEPSITSSAVHGPGYSGATPFAHRQTLPGGAQTTDFHTYAVEWDSFSVRFFIDGAMHYTVSRDQMLQYGKPILAQPYYVILNFAVGGHFDGDPQSDAIFPATMLVDYVRVFKASGQ